MTRDDAAQRPNRDRHVLGFRVRRLDLRGPDGSTFLRRRGIEHERLGGLLLHFLDGPDPGLDLHDHPWPFATLILRGGYTEEVAPIAAVPAHRYEPATWGAWLFDGEPDSDGSLADDLPLGVRRAMEESLRGKAGGTLPHERPNRRLGNARPHRRTWRRWSTTGI